MIQFKRYLKEKKIVIHSDNTAAGYLIRGHGKTMTRKIRQRMRELAGQDITYEIIPRKENIKADQLNRLFIRDEGAIVDYESVVDSSTKTPEVHAIQDTSETM